MSAFVWSVKNGDLSEVKNSFEKGQDVNAEIDGRYPLHFAADYGQREVIDYLILKGADVNKKDKHGITPILAAIWEGHTLCVQTLLEKGAIKDGKAPDGSSYINCAETEDIKKLLK